MRSINERAADAARIPTRVPADIIVEIRDYETAYAQVGPEPLSPVVECPLVIAAGVFMRR